MWLTIRSGDRAGERVEVTAERFVAGREEGCDLVLAAEKASRRHAAFERFPDGRYAVRDLGSTNGTFVDGKRIAGPVVLEGGEEIRIGDAVLAFSLTEPGLAPPTVAAGAPPTIAAEIVPVPPAAGPATVPAAAPVTAQAEAQVPPPPSRPKLSGAGRVLAAGAAAAFLVAAGAAAAMFASGEKAAAPAVSTTAPATTAPPETTEPATTAPATTAPETTEPASTVPIAAPGVPMAFTSDQDGDSEIYYMAADGSVTQITSNTAADGAPSLSPDGTRIAFYSDQDGDYDIYAMNVDGSGLVQVTNEPGGEGYPSWSPDGARVAFNSDRDGDWDIWVANADGSDPAAVTANTTADGNPMFSPDPSLVRIVLDADPDGDGDGEIYVVNGDGSGLSQLTSSGDAEFPAWSPDGTRIAFGSNADGDYDVYVMNADGSGLTQLTNEPGIDGYPRWLPDGRIAFHSDRTGEGNWDVFVTNADGSGLTQATTGLATDAQPSFAVPALGGVVEGDALTELLSHVPEAFRSTCEPVAPENRLSGDLAAVFCTKGPNIEVYYNLFPDAATMQREYDAVVDAFGATRDTGDCVADALAENDYTIGGEPAGRYVCLDSSDGWRYILWTDERLNIRSSAFQRKGNRQAIYDFWLNEAGPDA